MRLLAGFGNHESEIAEARGVRPEHFGLHAIADSPLSQPRYGTYAAFLLTDRHNSLNRKKRFLLLTLLPRTRHAPAQNGIDDLKEVPDLFCDELILLTVFALRKSQWIC
ncbi:hypothetical protein [Rosenbergiella nectarea]|uniref:hypothetical protein n=1 Tax=Rosenbergiella nectarea TaxID=988801 RepID=UPI001BDB5C78|nr:hypothetical protein [Rosenbergiella nectarea]MBT0729585.1 hypothetical protein [Rosenbergiella nectarea subsp. apis]